MVGDESLQVKHLIRVIVFTTTYGTDLCLSSCCIEWHYLLGNRLNDLTNGSHSTSYDHSLAIANK